MNAKQKGMAVTFAIALVAGLAAIAINNNVAAVANVTKNRNEG